MVRSFRTLPSWVKEFGSASQVIRFNKVSDRLINFFIAVLCKFISKGILKWEVTLTNFELPAGIFQAQLKVFSLPQNPKIRHFYKFSFIGSHLIADS